MTVHIREFVLRLGIEDKDASRRTDTGESVTAEDLENLRRDLLRRLNAGTGGTRPQPFDR